MIELTVTPEDLEGSLYQDNVLRKARVCSRRKTKFGFSQNGYHNHPHNLYYPNSSDGFCDEESCDGKRIPKYWHGNKQLRFPTIISTTNQFRDALRRIAVGKKNPGDYDINGPNIWRERIDTVRFLRGKGVDMDVKYISSANYDQLAQLRKNAPKVAHRKGKWTPEPTEHHSLSDFVIQRPGFDEPDNYLVDSFWA